MINRTTLLKMAVDEALKSDHQHRIGCIIYSKNTILSRGYNVSLESRKKLHPRFRKWPNSIHAEVNAILSARKNLKGADVFIVRINKHNELLLARPCKYCMSYLHYVGVKKITYSIQGGFKEECLSNVLSAIIRNIK